MVGSHLADFLLKNTNWTIHGMCRWRSSQENIKHIIPLVNRKERVFLHYGDLCDNSSIFKIINEVCC